MDLVFPPPSPSSSTAPPIPAPADPPSFTLPLPHRDAYPDEPREYARALMQRKDEIEKEIEALKDVLTSHGATSNTSLVDPEGYPRGDIDIYAIRHTRSTLVRLQNDRAAVSDLLAIALQDAFSTTQPQASSSSPSAQAPNGRTNTNTIPQSLQNGHLNRPNGDVDMVDGQSNWPERAVAKVNSVAPSSPASQAGLLAGDLIFDFAGVIHSSPGGLQAIGALVAQSEGTSLPLLVLRGNDRIQIHLTPRSGWGGRGLLGCHILPA